MLTYAMVAIVVVLLILWLGINFAFIRRQEERKGAAPDMPQTPEAPEELEGPGAPQPESAPSTAQAEDVSHGENRPAVEVDSSVHAHERPGVFHHRDQAYVLHAVNAPMFSDMAWQTAFKRLSDDERVLGWVAFHDERVGASDRSYDQDFLEALRQHRRATEKLRRHVGLSQVTETAVVGEEGKVWFLTVMDDAWFALFIDKDVDGVRLANELLDPVQTVPSSDSLSDA
jgi:hypothetical protein